VPVSSSAAISTPAATHQSVAVFIETPQVD